MPWNLCSIFEAAALILLSSTANVLEMIALRLFLTQTTAACVTSGTVILSAGEQIIAAVTPP